MVIAIIIIIIQVVIVSAATTDQFCRFNRSDTFSMHRTIFQTGINLMLGSMKNFTQDVKNVQCWLLAPALDPISRLLSALQLLSKLTNSMMDEIDRWWWHWWRGQQWWRGWWRGWCCAGSCATSRWGLPWFQLFSRDGPLQGECLPSSYISFCHFCQVALARWPCHLPLSTCINSHVTLSKPPFVWPLPNEISYEILFIFELRTETCLASSPKQCLEKI